MSTEFDDILEEIKVHDLDEGETLSKQEQINLMRESVIANENTSLHVVESPELEKTLKTLRHIRDVSIKDLMQVDEHGNEHMIQISDLPDEVAAAIASVKMKINHRGRVGRKGNAPVYETLYDEDGEEVLVADHLVEIDIKFWDKLSAADKLMRYEGAFERDNEQKKTKPEEMMDMLIELAGADGLPTPTDNNA